MLSKNRIKDIQSLGQKKFREQEGLFIAEGPKIVEDLLQPGILKVKEVFALESWSARHTTQVPVTIIEEFELEKISQLNTPNQVLAVVEMPKPGALPDAGTEPVLALDDIRDPGNLGTIIRIADWFGLQSVVCSQETAELFNPKTVQSAMGSLAHVQVHYTNLGDWIFSQTNTPIYVAVLDGEDPGKMEKISRGIIVIGNESKGIRPEIIDMASRKITIPAKGKAESLNAAVATGIILSHLI